MSNSDPEEATNTKTGRGGFIGTVIGLSALVAMVVGYLIGIVILTSIFWLPFLILFFSMEYVIDLLPIHWIIRNMTTMRVSSENSNSILWTLLLLLPGAAIGYRGFIIHRRHAQIVGFITAFIVSVIVGATAGLSGIGLLLLGTLSGLFGAKFALTMEVAIAMLFGFLFVVIFSAILFNRPISDPVVLIFGVGGALLAWRLHVVMILFGTAATGAAWMTFVSLGTPGSIFRSVAFAPIPVVLLFLYLFITCAGIQTYFIEEVIGPINYLQAGKDDEGDRSPLDDPVGQGGKSDEGPWWHRMFKEETVDRYDLELTEEAESKLLALGTVLTLSVTNSLLFVLIGTAIVMGLVPYAAELLLARERDQPVSVD